MGSARGFWFGVLEALLVPLAFVALGLLWWGGVERAPLASAAYPVAVSQGWEQGVAAQAGGELWLVDGFNVVQVALLAGRDRSAWWTAPFRAELIRRARGFSADAGPPAELWVAFDGRRTAEEADGPVRWVYVRSADDWLVARVRAAEEPARVRVVTADRRLAARARHHGARVVSPADFLSRCGEVGSDGEAPSPLRSDRGEITTL